MHVTSGSINNEKLVSDLLMIICNIFQCIFRRRWRTGYLPCFRKCVFCQFLL